MTLVKVFSKKRRINIAFFVMKTCHVLRIELLYHRVNDGSIPLHLQNQIEIFFLNTVKKKTKSFFYIILFRQTRIAGKINKAIEIFGEPFYKAGSPGQADKGDLCIRISMPQSAHGRYGT